MSGSFDGRGRLDIADGLIITCTGKKKSGKSLMALVLFRSYRGDKIVVDVAGDDGPTGEGIIELRGQVDELPTVWPEDQRDDDGSPMTLRYMPDAGSSTYLDDVDAVIGLALHHPRPCCILIHEVGLVASAGRTPPNMRRLLNANRHYHTTGIFCTPRPMTIDPLIIAQSDLLYIFETRNSDDRERLAKTIGWAVPDMDAAISDLGRHEYLRFDANEEKPEAPDDDDIRLVHFPPLPADHVAATKRWAAGQPLRGDTHAAR